MDGFCIAEQDVPWSEPCVNPPVYCTGVASAAVIGGQVHIVYYIEQPAPGGVERLANLRIILPLESLGVSREIIDTAIIKAVRRFDA